MKSGYLLRPPHGDLDASQTGSIPLTKAEAFSLRIQTHERVSKLRKLPRHFFEGKGLVNRRQWGGYCSCRIQGNSELVRCKGIYANIETIRSMIIFTPVTSY